MVSLEERAVDFSKTRHVASFCIVSWKMYDCDHADRKRRLRRSYDVKLSSDHTFAATRHSSKRRRSGFAPVQPIIRLCPCVLCSTVTTIFIHRCAQNITKISTMRQGNTMLRFYRTRKNRRRNRSKCIK